MNHTPDAVTADNGGSFDPQQAAALLDQTTQQARRQLEPAQPWLLAIRAVLFLCAAGAIWFSVRGQHPYKGLTGRDIPILVGFIVVNFTATVAVRRRAIAGVSGRTRFTEGEIALLIGAFVVTIVAMMGLGAAGASFAFYPTTVLVIPGLVWGALSAARSHWRGVATGLAIVIIGIVGAFAGSAGSWAVAAVGLCAVLLSEAAVIIWQQRRSVVRP